MKICRLSVGMGFALTMGAVCFGQHSSGITGTVGLGSLASRIERIEQDPYQKSRFSHNSLFRMLSTD
jgi:hypothetical protein